MATVHATFTDEGGCIVTETSELCVKHVVYEKCVQKDHEHWYWLLALMPRPHAGLPGNNHSAIPL